MASKLKLPSIRITDATHTRSLRNSYYKKLTGLFSWFNRELQPGLARMLARNPEPGYIREFSDKINNISDITIYAGSPKIIDESVKLSYKSGKERAAVNPRVTRESIRIDPRLSYYDMRLIEDLKIRNMGLVTKLTEDVKSELIRTITDGIKTGRNTGLIAKDISNNIDGISKPRAKMIARTEIAYSYNTAVGETYKKAGIEQWQWLATLGTTCCEECQNRHGEVYDWSDEQPPLHPNCYCTMYPVLGEKGF